MIGMHTTVDDVDDLKFIIDLIYERCRIRLHEGKEQLIRARLGKLIRRHQFEGLHDYCNWLRGSAQEDDIQDVVDALTTNFTNFLREREHFDFMVQHALPPLLPAGKKRFRVWSSACATGEEPYSIAFQLAESFPLAAGWDWQVLATDISNKALKNAKNGIYRDDRLQGMPPEWVRKYFQKGHGDWDGHYRVKSSITERVSFERLNLLGSYSFREPFELIFCRNVMIYFDRPTQETLVNQLCRWLVPKGFLLVGHSESLIGMSMPLKCKRPSIYQRD